MSSIEMVGFILVNSYITTMPKSEDEVLNDALKEDLGESLVLVNVEWIGHIFEDVDKTCVLLLKCGTQIVSNNTMKDIIAKINKAQVSSVIN